MSLPFFGRKRELASLAKFLTKSEASFVVITGRRRIGKSRLVEQFAQGHRFLRFSGLPPIKTTTRDSELRAFALQLSMQTGLPESYADDWAQLFFLLSKEVATGRVIILFDEISWMGSKDPDFLGKLKTAWDLYFKHNPELILILCGSISPWIHNNIIANEEFAERISLTLTVEELSLIESNQFWLEKNDSTSNAEKLKLLSVIGGIPRYLEEIDTELSAEENIRNLCFIDGALLMHEFKDLFSDFFSKRVLIYKRIAIKLAKGSMESKDIAQSCRISLDTVNEYLQDMVNLGYICKDDTICNSVDVTTNNTHFWLSDNYMRFYLECIAKQLPRIKNHDFEYKSLSSLPGWNTIMGYQFENLVLKNRRYIRECLGITSENIVTDNPFFQRTTKKNPGCQIDYLIQTKFGGLYVCEMKFNLQPVGMNVIKEMQEKIERLSRPKGLSIWPVLIHVNGVQEEVVNSGYFAKIIDFSQILSETE